jgi:hypothetical protein
MLYDFFAEIPWYIPGTLLLVGAVLVYTAGEAKRPRQIGWPCLGLAIALIAVSWALESDREAVTRQTYELVKSVESRDWPAMERLLDAKVRLPPLAFSREPLVEAAKLHIDQVGIKSLSVANLTVGPSDKAELSTFQVSADARDTGAVLTKWRLTWEKRDKKWVVTEIAPLDSVELSADGLRDALRGKFGL